MKVIIITTSFGFIALDEDYNIVTSKLFLEDNLSYIEALNEENICEYEIEFINELSSDFNEIVMETNNGKVLYDNLNISNDISVEKQNPYGEFVRDNLYDIVCDITGDSSEELLKITHDSYEEHTKNKIRESVKTNDVMIVETINALEDLEESTGKLIERLREWCTPYLPELDKLNNHQLYAKIISTETTRSNVKNSSLLENTNIELSDDYNIVLEDNDLNIIKSFATSLYGLYESKNTLESYIQEKIQEVAPNLYDVAGANLAAKLIAHCNGLENLAKLPSSTVQIIGAEKAVFRHLKTGEKPPKHGLIFQHPSIRGSNWWVRGKLARAVAGKISIAARKDAFMGEYDPTLKEQLDEKVEKIKKDHPFPERKNKKTDKDKDSKSKKNKKNKKDKRKKSKRNKRKLKKGEYTY